MNSFVQLLIYSVQFLSSHLISFHFTSSRLIIIHSFVFFFFMSLIHSFHFVSQNSVSFHFISFHSFIHSIPPLTRPCIYVSFLSCHWFHLLSFHFMGISKTFCSFIDAPHILNLLLLLHFTDIPRRHWFLIVNALFRNVTSELYTLLVIHY